MWSRLERILAVVGGFATIVGTGIAVYAFLFPADITDYLRRLVEKAESEIEFSDAERFEITTGVVFDPTYFWAIVQKAEINSSAIVKATLCAGKKRLQFSVLGFLGLKVDKFSKWMETFLREPIYRQL